jgi:hypothetical protein
VNSARNASLGFASDATVVVVLRLCRRGWLRGAGSPQNSKYHQRQLVDSFRSNLPNTGIELLESHQRKLVDSFRSSLYQALFNVEKILDLNNPPTSVGGILWTSLAHFRRLDLNKSTNCRWWYLVFWVEPARRSQPRWKAETDQPVDWEEELLALKNRQSLVLH